VGTSEFLPDFQSKMIEEALKKRRTRKRLLLVTLKSFFSLLLDYFLFGF
jgi:hypothetical protein